LPDDRRLLELENLSGHPAPYHLFHGCNAAFGKALAVSAGLLNEEFDGRWGYEDTEFAFRIWRLGGMFRWSLNATALHQENSITSFCQRVFDEKVNFELACLKIPGFKAFKKRLQEHNRIPWW
jgi:hypothetical protein